MKGNSHPDVQGPATAVARPGTHGPRRILVVEDDSAIRELNAAVLVHHGYRVDAADDGAVAWDSLQANRYDLLITDNDMPRVTGVELIKKLRAARMALPVIMATGAIPPEEDIARPWLAALLLKPYTPDQLLGTVRDVLQATDNARDPAASPPQWQSLHASERSWR
jgi:DNA-binding response OmpR family regulator